MIKICNSKNTLHAAVLTGLLSASAAFAGETTMTAPTETAPIVKEEKKVVSGTLSLQANTHFISYGSDVWGSGERWNDTLFNPSLELGLELGSGFKLILGTWWDVNDNADSDIAKRIQEVDAWAGIGYTLDKFSFTLMYQAWMYGGETEQIVDFKVNYATFLNPSILIHGRTDSGAAAGKEGAVLLLGISEGFNAGPVAFSFPVNVAFMTSGYQGRATSAVAGIPAVPPSFGIPASPAVDPIPGRDEADAGFGFASAAAIATVPVPFIPGEWTFSVGATYYYTNDDVIPLNRDDSFVTGSAGLTLTF